MAQFQEKTLHFASLGCSKNLVDSQVMLGVLKKAGFQVVERPEQAEAIVVNTCSFIEAAKKESIDTILELADYKNEQVGRCQALVVSGCLAQRYSRELEEGLPEVDLFIGTGEYRKINTFLQALAEGKLEKKSFVEIPRYIHTEFDPRINTSPGHMAWLKVSEGCNRNCTFCIIPKLRGKLRSRSVDSLVAEAQKLAASGVRELNLISQDLSDYGVDLAQSENLLHLIQALDRVEGVDWIRLFYYYPEDLTSEVMEFMGQAERVVPYLDMPVQHFSSSVLKRMNRRATQEQIYRKIERLRKSVPGITLRTSVIVGFPGETQEDFEALLAGVQSVGFDHLGVFKYSDEEDTPAYRLTPKIAPEVIEERFNRLYQAQAEIVHKKNQQKIGQRLSVLVEGAHEETDLLLRGRHPGQAPDIDGQVIINEGLAYPGEIVTVEVTDAHEYDLVGRIW